MRLYLDASALVKLLLVEPESVEVAAWWAEADEVLCSSIGYVEARAAIARRLSGAVAKRARLDLDSRWEAVQVVTIDDTLVELAARLADIHRLRALDALHLAAAQRLSATGIVFGCWDRELSQAARAVGFATAP